MQTRSWQSALVSSSRASQAARISANSVLPVDAVRSRVFERPEMAAEGELLFVVDLLAVKDQHGEFVHAGGDGRDLPGADRAGQIDAVDHSGEIGQAVGLGRESVKCHCC